MLWRISLLSCQIEPGWFRGNPCGCTYTKQVRFIKYIQIHSDTSGQLERLKTFRPHPFTFGYIWIHLNTFEYIPRYRRFFFFYREHSCLKPSFDLDVPYLLATLIPSQLDIQPNLIPPYIPVIPPRIPENSQSIGAEHSDEKEANLKKIGVHAMKLLQQYQSDFSTKMTNWMKEFMEQIQLLCLSSWSYFCPHIFWHLFSWRLCAYSFFVK